MLKTEQMHCFYLDGRCSAGQKVWLSPDQSHHLARVLRLCAGDAVTLLTSTGEVFCAEVAEGDPRRAELLLGDCLPRPSGPTTDITLAFPPPKGGRSDLIAEKATELGVTALQPLICERLQGWQAETAEKRSRRWRRKVLAAVRQCKRTSVPLVKGALSLTDFLCAASADLALVAVQDRGAVPLCHALGAVEGDVRSICLMVGPEGGLTPREVQSVGKAGFVKVRLGRNTLRVETAALALLAAVVLHCDARSTIQPESL